MLARHLSLALVLTLALAPTVAGCAPTMLGDETEGDATEPFSDPDLGTTSELLSVGGAVSSRCSTSAVRGLSEQLIEEMNCMRPGLMSSIAGISGVELGDATFPYLQREAAAALRRAAARRGGTMHVNSALRTLPQQYLLYRWYRTGRCGIGLAASPGRSNHQSGLALDISEYSTWRSAMEGEGFRWFGSADRVHFDFDDGTDVRQLSVLAFQRLWNRAHPEDRIGEDGDYGPATESRLARAPSEGFAVGVSCGEVDPMPEDPAMLASVDTSWTRGSDGRYTFTTVVPAQVASVEILVEGFRIGSASRGADGVARFTYAFNVVREQRALEVRGLDVSGALVARGVGSIDSVAGTAVYVRPTGDLTWEIGLERPVSGIAAIEVSADGWQLTDQVSGAVRSTRLAVRDRLTMLGSRTFVLTTVSSTGAVRGTLTRTARVE